MFHSIRKLALIAISHLLAIVLLFVTLANTKGMSLNPINASMTTSVSDSAPPAINLKAAAGQDSINLSWTLEGALEGDLERYELQRVGGDNPFTATRTLSQYTDHSQLKPNSEYCYLIYARDSKDDMIGSSNEACVTYGPLSLWIPDQVVEPKETNVVVPINIKSGSGLCIGAMDITIEYDSTIATANGTVEPTVYTEGYSFVANTLTPGKVKISSITGPTQCVDLHGGGSLFFVRFDISDKEGEMTTLDFIKGLPHTDIYDKDDLFKPVELTLQNGSLTIDVAYMRGDINGDGFVNAADAALALLIATGMHEPTPQQEAACDVNGDEVCNAADSSLILCYAAFQDWSQCGGSKSTNRLSETASSGEAVELRIGSFETSDTTMVPVEIENGADFTSGDFSFSYDASEMTATGVSLTSLTNDFLIKSNTQQAGLVRVSLASYERINADGPILNIEFTRNSHSRSISSIDFGSLHLNDATGRDFATSVLQHEIDLEPYEDKTEPTTTIIFLPTVIK